MAPREDEDTAKPPRRSLLSHYHVSKEGDRLTVTPPPYPPGAGRLFESLRPRESWAFSPGRAECIRGTSPKRPRVIEYAVSSVEIDHELWTGAALETALGMTNRMKGVTDHLRISGPNYSSRTVAALHCERLAPPFVILVHQHPIHGGGIVSPDLVGPAVAHGLPVGVGEAFDSEAIATVSPTILSLSRLITDATRCPLTIVVGSRSTPAAFSGNRGPGD
jgi:hypothetical protein